MNEGRYYVRQLIAEHQADDPRYRERVEHCMKTELGVKLVTEIPIDEPVMVRIRRDERDGRLPFSEHAPLWMADRAIEIRYEFELRQCRSMDQIVIRPVYRDPAPEIRYVDRPAPYPVYIKVEQPTFWQRITTHLSSLAAEVQYDGGYGEPL